MTAANRKPRVNRIDHSERKKGYRYQDKEPMLYLLLYLMDASGLDDNEIARRSTVGIATLERWRYERCRLPRLRSIQLVLRAVEVEFAGINTRTGEVMNFGVILDSLMRSRSVGSGASGGHVQNASAWSWKDVKDYNIKEGSELKLPKPPETKAPAHGTVH